MTINLLEPAKAALLVFVAAILQVTIFNEIDILGGYPDLVLLTLVAVALLRGSIYGAACGFFGGPARRHRDAGTLGVTSLLLTIAGYWIGRYGETTGRDRLHAPFVSVAVVTVLSQIGALILHYMLGDDGLRPHRPARGAPGQVGLNLLLTLPVYALARRAAGACDWRPSARRRCASLASTGTRQPRTGSDRFLPPDPRVEEPYRLTPQLALRIGILGGVALRGLRGALLPALGAAGALGHAVPARGARQPAALDARGGAARADPRPTRAVRS